ncbi:MAG: hypothetical protein HY718_08090, partial [Planctomycetes bacterium]|nr:hypothetical protein [Planctomycetota bacterium]
MKSSHFVAAICGVFVISVTSARAQHVDIRPYVRDGAIVTGSAELVGGVVTP